MAQGTPQPGGTFATGTPSEALVTQWKPSLEDLPSLQQKTPAAEQSADSRFGELMEFVTPHFDWIVVDSSPVTLVSDAVNLARHCDGVLLVVRAGMTKYQKAQQAQHELQAAPLLGVVLNAVEDKLAPSYYGYGPAGPAESAA